MIKKLKILLFTLLVNCFILFGGSFVDAVGVYTQVGVNSVSSPVNSSYSITPLKGGGFLSNYLGVGKSVLALDTSRIFWWTPNGYPYVYLKGGRGTVEGFFDRYYSCDLMTGYNSPVNCSETFIDYSGSTSDFDYQVFKSFFSTVNQGQLVHIFSDDYVYIGSTYDETRNALDICWNSEEIGKSFCFKGGYCYWSRGNRPNDCDFGNLVNSQNYYSQLTNGLTFGNIPYNSIGYAPGQVGYLGQFNGSTDGSTQGTINNQITGDYVYGTCNYKEILVLLETEGYNPYICYGGLDNFSLYDSSVNYNPIPGSGLSIIQIWGNSTARAWDTFTDWFIFWNGLYKDTSNNYTAMWESYPAVYRTYFQLYNQYKGSTLDSRTILEYCNLKLSDIDLNNTAGGYFAPFCKTVNYEKQVGIRQSRLDGTIYSEGVYTGDYPISVNWGGVGNMSGLEIQSDGLTFIQDYFNVLKAKLSTNYSDGFRGVIPSYIIVFLLAIILFKFLSK